VIAIRALDGRDRASSLSLATATNGRGMAATLNAANALRQSRRLKFLVVLLMASSFMIVFR
jgi:hypothetical protein